MSSKKTKKDLINLENTILKKSALKMFVIVCIKLMLYYIYMLVIMLCVTTVAIVSSYTVAIVSSYIDLFDSIFGLILMLILAIVLTYIVFNKIINIVKIQELLPEDREKLYLYNNEILLLKISVSRRCKSIETYSYIKEVTSIENKPFVWLIKGYGYTNVHYIDGQKQITNKQNELTWVYNHDVEPIELRIGKLYKKREKELLLSIINKEN